MTVIPNGLRELEAKIKGLPIQEALLRRRERLHGTKDQVQQRQAELQDGVEQAKALRIFQSDQSLLADAERRALATVRNRAQELLTLVTQPDQDNNEVSTKLDAIKRAVKTLSDLVKVNWSQACQEQQGRADALKPLAQHLSSNLLSRITQLEQLLQANSTSPPTATPTVRAMAEARKALAAEVATMKMTGPIEVFLRDAQNRRGDPRALLDPQVCEYLNAHPALWKSLRVVLG